jgi:RNA polymerase sigma-70 factor (ECF subfamily)
MSDSEDRNLVERTLRGDRTAFRALVDRYASTVYGVASRVVGPGPDAEDVAQNVFLKVYENLASYRPSYRFFSWIYRIALNESMNVVRSRKSHDSVDRVSLAAPETADRALESSLLEDAIGEALMELEPSERALVILRHYEDLPYRDIAFIMDLKESLVKSRLFTARRNLRALLVNRGIWIEP